MVKFWLDDFETIGQTYSAILKDTLKITTIEELVKIPFNEIVEKTQIEETRIQQWFEIADLLQIPHLSIKNSELLRFAKINSVTELSHREAIRILYKFQYLDKNTYHIITKIPSLNLIETWINYAKLMTQRIMIGDNIPLICFPMINLDYSSNFQKHQIIMLRNLEEFPKLDLQKNIGMNPIDVDSFIQMKNLLKIDGIDIYLANLLMQAELSSIKELVKTDEKDIFRRIQSIQVDEENPLEILSMAKIQNLKEQAKYYSKGDF